MEYARSSFSITLSVWQALFLREAVSRIASGRGAWMWLLLEPVAHAAFIMLLFTLVRLRTIPGADAVIWLVIGFTSFLTARNIYSRGMEAINANQALFVYRQVLPVDTVLVRSALEIFIGLLVTILLLAGAALFGFQVLPGDPLKCFLAFLGLCLNGVGLGLILAVGTELIPELGKIANMLFTPLYFLSGVMFPVVMVPVQYREWLFLNPFAHGIELVRAGFFPYYHAAPEASMGFLYFTALASLFFGLALQLRYAMALRAQ